MVMYVYLLYAIEMFPTIKSGIQVLNVGWFNMFAMYNVV